MFGGSQIDQLLIDRRDTARSPHNIGKAIRMCGERVEQGKLVLARKQGLMLVLAMDLDHQPCGFAQDGQ